MPQAALQIARGRIDYIPSAISCIFPSQDVQSHSCNRERND